MLLYSMLYLTGFGLELDDIREFRQWGSRTPGHPEYGHTTGVEMTTGPLGQGFANAVGFAINEKHLRERFGAELCDHRDLRYLQRRRLHGGHQPRSRVARRSPEARPHGVRLRRQPHHDRRPDGADVQRQRAEALRGVRLARRAARRGRERSRRARSRTARGHRRGDAADAARARARTSDTRRPRCRTPRPRTATRSAPTRSRR